MKAFNFEIYTCHPITGEGGYDIKFPTVYANTKEEAKLFLKNEYPNFDCIILFNYGIDINESDIDVKAYANGANYRDTEYMDRYNF